MHLSITKACFAVALSLAGSLVVRAQEPPPTRMSQAQDPVVRSLAGEIADAADITNASLAVISQFLRIESDRYFDLATAVGGHSGFERHSVELSKHANSLDPMRGSNEALLRQAMFILNRDSGRLAVNTEIIASALDRAQEWSEMTDREWRWLQNAPTGDQIRRLAGRQGEQNLREVSVALDAVANATANVLSIEGKVAEAKLQLGRAEGDHQIQASWSDSYLCKTLRVRDYRDFDGSVLGAGDNWAQIGGVTYEFEWDNSGRTVRDSSGLPIKIRPDRRKIRSKLTSGRYHHCFIVTSVDPLAVETFGESGWEDVDPVFQQAAVASVLRYAQRMKSETSEVQDSVDAARRNFDLWQRFSESIFDDGVAGAEAAQTAVGTVWETWADAQDAAARLRQRLAALESRRE